MPLILISRISRPNSRVFLDALHSNFKKYKYVSMKVTFLLFIFYFSLHVLSPPSSETEQEYVHKDKKNLLFILIGTD